MGDRISGQNWETCSNTMQTRLGRDSLDQYIFSTKFNTYFVFFEFQNDHNLKLPAEGLKKINYTSKIPCATQRYEVKLNTEEETMDSLILGSLT